MQTPHKHKTLVLRAKAPVLSESGDLKASLETKLDLVQQSCVSVFSTNKRSLSAWLFYRVEVSVGQEPGPLLCRPLLLLLARPNLPSVGQPELSSVTNLQINIS